MIVAIDVHYRETFAKVVSIEFAKWGDLEPCQVHEQSIYEVEEYIPGQFYKRELPCILEILTQTDLNKVGAIIVDGYVVLDDFKKPGLGMYLYEALDQQIPIIGVAKRAFKDNIRHVIEVKRGESDTPLFITSVGIPVQEAANQIKHMAGEYRMPTLLKLLDQKTKELSL